MYGNDTLGDCTVAAAAHMIELWTAVAGVERSITLESVVAAYHRLSPNDDGANMLNVLRFWRRNGIGGDRIAAFAQSDMAHIRDVVSIFGCAYVGVSLPDAVVNADDPLLVPWGDGAVPDPNNGHCIPIVAYDPEGPTCISWAARKKMTWGFLQNVASEILVAISQDFIMASGKTLGGLALVSLVADAAFM